MHPAHHGAIRGKEGAVSSGTLLSDTRMSSSIPTPDSSVLPSILTKGTQSTPCAPWSYTWERGGASAGHTSSLLQRVPIKGCKTLVLTSLSSLLENQVLEKLRTPRR